MDERKVYFLDANELDLESKHINDFTDEEFCQVAMEKGNVLNLTDFVLKFNLGLIDISSDKDFMRII